jgi:hypothetical protein
VLSENRERARTMPCRMNCFLEYMKCEIMGGGK